MVKRFSCAVTLIMLASTAVSAHPTKIKGQHKVTDLTLKRGVVSSSNLYQWGTSPAKFSRSVRKPE